MTEQPLVSVICSCYNHNNYIIEALNSVMNQSYANIQLIVVDDYSNDQSKKTIQEWCVNYPNVLFIANPKNLGITKSFNNAYKHVKGDFIIDLAGDDRLLTNCIELQLNLFKTTTYKNIGVVYGNVKFINENGQFLRPYYPIQANGDLINKIPTGQIYCYVLSESNSICSVSALVKKSVYDSLNGYDENLYFEDLDFWIRASKKYDFDFTPKYLVEKREVTNSLGDYFSPQKKHYKGVNNSIYLALKKAFLANTNPKENKSLLQRVYRMLIRAIKAKDIYLCAKYFLFILRIKKS